MTHLSDLLDAIPKEGDVVRFAAEGRVWTVQNNGPLDFNVCPDCLHEFDAKLGPGHFQRRVCLEIVNSSVCPCRGLKR